MWEVVWDDMIVVIFWRSRLLNGFCDGILKSVSES